jgi:predicted dehydrogenase
MNTSRRDFIKKSAALAAGLTILPSHVVSGLGHKAPSDKLNIVGVGIGGKGRANLDAMNTENIIALCDVDWKYAKGTFDAYPKAEKFTDWRVLFDKLGKSIDGVLVATPDHSHAVVAANAITLGKHVYCQKPLTHTVYESRLLTNLAKKYKVATQLGNQGGSCPEVRDICEWIWNGEIGEVKEVHAWTNRPLWPQGMSRPTDTPKVPSTLQWDLFLGTAPYRPYHPAYTPWNWRGWWDFGTGALGDMACHIMDPINRALDLKYPINVQGSSTAINTESAPQAESVHFTFPARPNRPLCAMPEVKVSWYDGGIYPQRPAELLDGTAMLNDWMGGILFVGSKDKLICDLAGVNPRLLSGRVPNVPKTLRRIEGYKYGGIADGPHEQDWIRACKESSNNRVEAASNFDYAGPFNEMIVMGVLAIRLQDLNRTLRWDGENMQFTNISDTDTFQIMIKDGFEIKDGNPTFDKTMTDPINAKQFVAELIKHEYRAGWSLPAMP